MSKKYTKTIRLTEKAHLELGKAALEEGVQKQELLERILKDWFWEKANSPVPDVPWEEGK